MNTLLTKLAEKNLRDILTDAICVQESEKSLIIFDSEAPLTQIILEGYRAALPQGHFVDFNTVTAAQIMEYINSCKPGDLVVLLQSTNFRLNEFRFRIELFARGLKTIEHIHLKRIPEEQFERYIQGLFYDKNLYRPLGMALKASLDVASQVVVRCPQTVLYYDGGMEDTKLNVGDYSNMKNVGGTYPIGEVFTEAKNLEQVYGEAMIFGYADENHLVKIVEPFKVVIEKGKIVESFGPAEFEKILDLIRLDEEVHVREFGLGLNPVFSKSAIVSDITAFERQRGLHISLGAKHAIYQKPGFNRKHGRYHVDVFVDIDTIEVDGKKIFANGNFILD